MRGESGRVSAFLAALLLPALPGALSAQCAIDVIDSGIEAYRALSLELAQQVLDSALALNAGSAAGCYSQNATAWVYLGASQWLLDRPDEARRAFEQSVIQVPRFRPDPLEFPPDITDAFEEVRSATPSVAVEMPDETVIGPGASDLLEIRLTASTTHEVTVRVMEEGGDVLATLFRGEVEGGSGSAVIGWDGRDVDGTPVVSGRYEIEVVSEGGLTGPVRKVVTQLRIDSDAAPPSTPAYALDSAAIFPTDDSSGGGGIGKALTVLGVGLAGGAVVVAAPELLDGSPVSDARYAVAASLGVAGLIGFFQQMRGRDDDAPDRAPVPTPAPGDEGAPREPTLRIRPGVQSRVELGGARTEAGWSGGPPPSAN